MLSGSGQEELSARGTPQQARLRFMRPPLPLAWADAQGPSSSWTEVRPQGQEAGTAREAPAHEDPSFCSKIPTRMVSGASD